MQFQFPQPCKNLAPTTSHTCERSPTPDGTGRPSTFPNLSSRALALKAFNLTHFHFFKKHKKKGHFVFGRVQSELLRQRSKGHLRAAWEGHQNSSGAILPSLSLSGCSFSFLTVLVNNTLLLFLQSLFFSLPSSFSFFTVDFHFPAQQACDRWGGSRSNRSVKVELSTTVTTAMTENKWTNDAHMHCASFMAKNPGLGKQLLWQLKLQLIVDNYWLLFTGA